MDLIDLPWSAYTQHDGISKELLPKKRMQNALN